MADGGYEHICGITKHLCKYGVCSALKPISTQQFVNVSDLIRKRLHNAISMLKSAVKLH